MTRSATQKTMTTAAAATEVSPAYVAGLDSMILAPIEDERGEVRQDFDTPFGVYELACWTDMDEPRVELILRPKAGPADVNPEWITFDTDEDYAKALEIMHADIARRMTHAIETAQAVAAFIAPRPAPKFEATIAAPYPVSAATDSRVRRYAREEITLNLSNRGKRWSEEDRELLAEAFVAGATMQALVDHFGRSPASLMLALADLGLVSAQHPYAGIRAAG